MSATPPDHKPFCEGGHTAALTCADATAYREHERANPWHCWGASRNGYHRFGGIDDPPPDTQCANEGYERTWGELEATLIGRSLAVDQGSAGP